MKCSSVIFLDTHALRVLLSIQSECSFLQHDLRKTGMDELDGGDSLSVVHSLSLPSLSTLEQTHHRPGPISERLRYLMQHTSLIV